MKQKVSLDPWTEAHDAQTVIWLNDPHIRATFGITSTPTLDGHRRWRATQPGLSAFAVRAGHEHIGNALLLRDDRHRSAFLQIYLGSADHRGKGMGRESLSKLLAIGFGELGLHRIWLVTVPDNIAAERLYHSAGFVIEGTEREAILSDGTFRSQNRWSLLKPEYEARKAGEP